MDDLFRQRYAAARRAVIAAEFQNLNPMQREAVLTTEGPLLLLAGAGSGKTTVLIHRVANLLRYGCGSDSEALPAGVGERELSMLEEAAAGKRAVDEEIRNLCALDVPAPWQIIAITFTNKAAGELKARLEKRLGSEAASVWAMTFHSACARILRRDADRLGFSRNFTIYDSADSLAVMKRVLKEMDVDEKVFPPKAMLAACARYKDAMLTAAAYVDAEQLSGDIRRYRTAQICAAYAKRLRDADAMDFEDLLYHCVLLLRDNEDVRTYYQKKFRYVLIDEYQDTNHLQYRMAAMLAGGEENFCVVGDDDQSIYRFRGATIENILNFEKQYPDARTIRLEQNYRSTGNILAAANAVIANNKERKGKNLWTEAGAGALITHYVARNEDDEADFVARRIVQGGGNPRDYAVLYRTNAQSRSIEQAFKRRQVPYRIFGGTRFFDRAEVKDMLAYLWVVANPSDETRLLRIVNNPTRGIGAASLEKAQELAARDAVPLFEVLRCARQYPELGRTAGKMEDFCEMIRDLQEELSTADLGEFYDVLLDKTGYVRALEAKKSDEDLARIENVYELKTSMVKSAEENDGGDLYAFLDEVALYTDLDNYDQDADCAVMMTLHAAKGLEFPVVFVVGAEEGLFPGLMAIGDDSSMEEERRLCYVAITRAKRELYISSAAQRMLYGRTSANLPSRFLEEIPPQLLQRQGVRPREDRRESDDYVLPRHMAAPSRFSAPKAAPPKPRSNLSAPAVPAFKTGDDVEHKAFGRGVIVKLTPMGGDALAEINFADHGVKRLMLRVAAASMKKV